MADDGRVVTANLPRDLVSNLDEVADRINRSKSWIVREALREWLADENHRHELASKTPLAAAANKPAACNVGIATAVSSAACRICGMGAGGAHPDC